MPPPFEWVGPWLVICDSSRTRAAFRSLKENRRGGTRLEPAEITSEDEVIGEGRVAMGAVQLVGDAPFPVALQRNGNLEGKGVRPSGVADARFDGYGVSRPAKAFA